MAGVIDAAQFQLVVHEPRERGLAQRIRLCATSRRIDRLRSPFCALDETVQCSEGRGTSVGSDRLSCQSRLTRKPSWWLVQVLGLAEHEIGFQVLVELVGLRADALRALLEIVRDLRQQAAAEFALIASRACSPTARALVQTPAQAPGAICRDRRSRYRLTSRSASSPGSTAVAYCCRRGGRRDGAQQIQRRTSAKIGFVAAVAHRAAARRARRAHMQRRIAAELQGGLLQLAAPVDAGEARLRKQHFAQQPLDEIGLAAPAAAGATTACRQSGEAARRSRPSAGRSACLLGAAREVHAAQQQPAVEARRR